MILACNTESFLGITYDEATVVLKQATGNVRLLVISPTEEVEKRAEAKQAASDKAVQILRACDAGELLPRHTEDPEHFQCRFCDWKARCWE